MSQQETFNLQNLQSITRITHLPLVESGWFYAGSFYKKLKTSNHLLYWTLGQAESSILLVADNAQPALGLLQGPINSLDKMLCKSLDFVEKTIPSISQPPELIYWNTKNYFGTRIVKPVLKRADSVKQIGNQVLCSKYTTFAADTLDGALDYADKYVDKYLPDSMDSTEDRVEMDNDSMSSPAGKAIHHVDRFSRKLQRRLTKRTLAEVKALKEQSAEAVHVLIYVVELIAKDPKLALEKGKELWKSLSKDEPENQARPDNLEQLIVLLTRESARRLVHLINFSGGLIKQVPESLFALLGRVLSITDSLLKTVHLDNLLDVCRASALSVTVLVRHLNELVQEVLEQTVEGLKQPQPTVKGSLTVPKISVQLRTCLNGNDL